MKTSNLAEQVKKSPIPRSPQRPTPVAPTSPAQVIKQTLTPKAPARGV